MTTFDEAQEMYHAKFRAAGHTPTLYGDGSVDEFVTDKGIHNGPGCSTCGYTRCWHCAPYPYDDIPKCDAPAAEITASEDAA